MAHAKGKSHFPQIVSSTLWVPLTISCFALLTERGLFFDCIKCVSYLTSCNVSAAADASSSHSAQLSLRVFVYNTKKDTTKAKPQKNHKKLYSWCSEFISGNCRDKMKTFRTKRGCSLSVCFVDRRIKRMTLVFCREENMLGFFLAATEVLGY